MLGMQTVSLGRKAAMIAPLDTLQDTHGVAPRSARMYTRFFEQTYVRLQTESHRDMLVDALDALVEQHPELKESSGIGVYTKTQTHNTLFEHDWLRDIFDAAGLDRWEVLTFSMTNCASGLAAVHMMAALEEPFIILAGEKAFHPAGSRLSVGLLSEAAVCAVFLRDGRCRVRGTHVSHLSRYYINPDDMGEVDKKALQEEFESGLVEFLNRVRRCDPAYFDDRPLIVPYNLNAPLIRRALRATGLERDLITTYDASFGHMFCSDNYVSLARCGLSSGRPVFLFSAGMGVTFAAVKLEAAMHQSLNSER